ncbi:MAG: acyl transferase [Cyclobacteriaceae bacterium]
MFHHQMANNVIYQKYVNSFSLDTLNVKRLEQIPFLPIRFFKTHEVKSGDWQSDIVFESSGTTGQVNSRHFVRDLRFYKEVSTHYFERCYGKLSNTVILALLPSYLERQNASLVCMIDYFIQQTSSKFSGFYLYNVDDLMQKINDLRSSSCNILLFGVTFALLDFAEKFKNADLGHVTIIETGGMKGRRKEMIREEVHTILQENLSPKQIQSEYGMTELMSQAYAEDGIHFSPPPWFRVLIRDLNDPFSPPISGRSGGINIIDLANLDTCAFIETEDIGTKFTDNTFKVLGRSDNSEVRGCNLMVY